MLGRTGWALGEDLPGRSEANVGNGDATEDEECGETGKSEKPAEDVASALLVEIDECETAEQKLK